MKNNQLVKSIKNTLKDMNVSAKTTQIYEALSNFNDEKNWNIAAAKNINLINKFNHFKRLDTGSNTIDSVLQGIEPGDIVGVLSPTSLGKTSLSVAIASMGIKQGYNILHINAENSGGLIAKKYISNFSNSEDNINKNVYLNYIKTKLNLVNYKIDEEGTDLTSFIQNEYEAKPFNIMVIDYLDLFNLSIEDYKALILFIKEKGIILIQPIQLYRDGERYNWMYQTDIIIKIKEKINDKTLICNIESKRSDKTTTTVLFDFKMNKFEN